MKTLKLDEKTARKLYPTAVPEFKTLLEENFGKECFSQNITDRLKTFEDALEIEGIDSDEFYKSCAGLSPDELYYRKLKIIVKAANEGWVPDWNNSNEYKYYPWFDMRSGFGFSGTDYGYSNATTGAGSRLLFKSEELARYIGKQFTEEYKQFMCIIK